jgi:hypothetical protein
MGPKANGRWVIVLTFLVAYLLAIVPFPDWAMHYRTGWVLPQPFSLVHSWIFWKAHFWG